MPDVGHVPLRGPLIAPAAEQRDDSHAETALAHARLAGISTERIVNCWTLDRLLAWLSDSVGVSTVNR